MNPAVSKGLDLMAFSFQLRDSMIHVFDLALMVKTAFDLVVKLGLQLLLIIVSLICTTP